MARNTDWASVEGAYRAGVKSVNAIAQEFGLSEGAIRAKAKKLGWVRNPGETKRTIVAARMAGVTNEITNDVIRNIESAASEDVSDMERGLRINRHCLLNLEQAAETAVEPREIKTIVDATSAAIDAIRRIRGLDSLPSPNVTINHGGPLATVQEIKRLLAEEKAGNEIA